MKQHNFWKRTAAGIMAVLLVFGSAPLTGMSEVFERTAIVASADDEPTTISANTFEVGTTTQYKIVNGKYYKTSASATATQAKADITGQ